jgi:alcohol dehydrogenase, propanol-preferring
MRAAVFHSPATNPRAPLTIDDVPRPKPQPDQVLLRVLACGVCRTDLHITAGELPALHPAIIPGHQIVGEVVELGPAPANSPLHNAAKQPIRIGDRVGVSWMGGVDGTCRLCRLGEENLCDHPVFTGYSINGGYAEFVTARADFCLPLPTNVDPSTIAPLLCAGIIGFRSLRVAGVERGEAVGLFGFGSSAHLAIAVLKSWDCKVYVATRGEQHRELARKLGAEWVGDAMDRPPQLLDRAVTFAPVGEVVIAALSALRKGGVVAINAIHLDHMPEFDYDKLLWGERQIRSVANMTRQDGLDFLRIAHDIGIKPTVRIFPLDRANDALDAVADETLDGSAVIKL